ncbi:MAG: amino acid adenylation domain-containing protein [Ktedonobacteraceae bacterium]
MSDLDRRIASLSPSRRDLLLRKLGVRKSETLPTKIHRQPRTSTSFDLSFAQQRLWFFSQLEPKSSFYNIPFAIRMKGTLCINILEKSFQEIIRRHEILRTTFSLADGRPVQVIAEASPLFLPIIDLSSVTDEAERETNAKRAILSEIEYPFDLIHGPLLRLSLLRLNSTEHILTLTLHHIVSDAWSIGVLTHELTELYQAYAFAQASPLPDLTIQYVDYAIWQRENVQRKGLEAELVYWKRQLADAPSLLPLPLDHPRPAVQTHTGKVEYFVLPNHLVRSLRSLSQSEGATLFMTLLAAFQLLLMRYSGQEDIVVASPIANRTHIDLEPLIGFFVNTLVLRTNLTGDPRFRELLKRVRKTTNDAYVHQDLPFEMLVNELQPERNLSRNPLFQIMFALQNAPTSTLDLPDLTIDLLEVSNETSVFDLSISITDKEQELIGIVEYNSDIFEVSTIKRLLGHFQTLLGSIVETPDTRISQLQFLTDSEQRQITRAWNGARKSYPADRCIHQLFEEQVERTPDGVAVIFNELQITYWELNQQANKLAHYLRSLGIRPDMPVGLCIERSLDAIIAFLGILKAGGAYVLLDPTYPQERLSFMLECVKMPIVLTQEILRERLPAGGSRIIILPTVQPQADEMPIENLDSGVNTSNLMYILYTSGSTGRPKPVGVFHRSFVNLISWYKTEFDITHHDHVMLFTLLSFDLSQKNIFAPLITGGKLYILPSRYYDPQVIALLMHEYAITFLNCTPGAFYPIMDNTEASGFVQLGPLRRLLLGGELIFVQRMWAWISFEHFHTEITNTYGPAECTDMVSFYRLKEPLKYLTSALPIGGPIDNGEILVLDKHLQLLPVGSVGEIYIAGDGVGRGYIDDPLLTATKFVPNPFSSSPGTRMYSTGDLARYRSDGKLEFLGRADHQVKLRGFRIELGEIEAVLSQFAEVQESYVTVREDAASYKRLVAYVVLQPNSNVSRNKLRRFVAAKLPDYMVPAFFIPIASLPLIASGKIDHRALPESDMLGTETEKNFVAPRTRSEKLLADIWAQTLGVEQVGIHDNFFDLGGDSILSVQIVSRANQAGLKLTIKQMFLHQTIAEIVSATEISVTPEPALPIMQTERETTQSSFPLTAIQHWFFDLQLPEPHHFNMSVLLAVHQKLKLALLEKAIWYLLDHHKALRTRFVRDGLDWLQFYAPSSKSIPFTSIDLSGLELAERIPALEAAASSVQTSLNLQVGPLMRAVLFDLGDQTSHRLLIVVHHLVIDSISWRILLEDLQSAYEQLCQEMVVKLPAQTTSFKQWSQLLREYAHSGVLDQELDYWLTESRSLVKKLPIDNEDGDNRESAACTVTTFLSVQETRTLLQNTLRVYHAQMNEVLLTALALAFFRWRGISPLLIDLEGHGREDLFANINLLRTIGWFTVQYPVLLTVERNHSLAEALQAVKEQLHRIPGRGMGYGLLRYLRADNDIAARMQALTNAEVSFNYLGQFDQILPANSPFRPASESGGIVYSPQGSRPRLVEVNGKITDGRLQMSFTYADSIYQTATIERLAEEFMKGLRELIVHSQAARLGNELLSPVLVQKLSQEEMQYLQLHTEEVIKETLAQEHFIEDIYPVSPVQHGMLFHSLREQGAKVYFEQKVCTIHGEFHPLNFQRAWQRIVERHAVFRTAFIWKQRDEPVQVVLRHVRLPWEQYDWRELSSREKEQRLQIFLRADKLRGIELSQVPLMRLVLIQVAEDEYHFVWSLHHMLLDGWSYSLILKEIFAFYEAFNQGEELSLHSPQPYRDYIFWLRRQDLSQAERFWRQRLYNFRRPTPLGTVPASDRSTSLPSRYGELQHRLPESFTAALLSFARQHRLTLNTLIQGGWALLLKHLSKESDIVFGATVSGRSIDLIGVETMIGVFINTLPVRVQVSPQQPLLSWLHALQLQQIQAYQYEYSPLVQVQSWSDVPRGVPLFKSLLIFENYPKGAFLGATREFEIRDVRSSMDTNYSVTLQIVPDERLLLDIIYDYREWDDATVWNILKLFAILLRLLVAHADVLLQELEDELHQVSQQAWHNAEDALDENNELPSEEPL